MNQANVVLSLSEQETAGHNAIEAMLRGIPVVGTRVGCSEYLIQDYITGFAVTDNKSLLSSLDYLYNNLIGERKMGESAKNATRALYSYQSMIQAYFSLYKIL